MSRLLVFAGVMLFAGVGYLTAELTQQRYRTIAPFLQPGAEPASLLPADDFESATKSAIFFEDVAGDSGVDFAYYDGAEGLYFFQETTGGGMAVLDYDNDGQPDLFFINGSRLPVDPNNRTHQSQLYRQRDAGFVDVTQPAQAGVVAYGQGAAAGDFDNDGFDDLLVTGFGSLHLLRNNGDGTFSDVSVESRMQSDRWCTSAAFADLDGDGNLDLYVCTYAEVDLENPHWCGHDGRRLHCHPQKYSPQPDLLFRNLADGRFVECSVESGVIDDGGRGLGLAIADLTGNKRPDIFVANDTSEAFLFVNQGDFQFKESALERGIALSGEGSTMAGMGVACADYDQNGWLDILVTDYYEEKNVLFQNLGEGGFVDNSGPSGLASPSRDRLGWGAAFIDADLSGWDDLFIANGNVSDFGDRPYAMRQQFFQQLEPGRFEDVSDAAGLYFQKPMHGRGVAWADLNNDGLPDVVVSHIRQQVAVLINRTQTDGRWLGMEFVGKRSTRNGRNVRMRMHLPDKVRHFETVAGTGYLSSSDRRLLIGLGEQNVVERLEVHWPSGTVQTIDSPTLDRYHLTVEPMLEMR